MKTIDLEEIKDEISKQYFGSNWDNLFDYEKAFLIDYVSIEFAKQCCDEQIKACWKNSDIHFDEAGMMDNYIRTDCVAVDKESILSTPNIAEKP